MQEVKQFLVESGCPKTAEHSGRVAEEARRLAALHGEDHEQAWQAGWLHDVGGATPVKEREATARAWGLEVLPEEVAFPLILHQKLSVVIARERFGVTDPAVLDAVGCHTTLRAGATRLDRILFLADKLQWDQADQPPYLGELLAAAERSPEAGTRWYLRYLSQHRAALKVVHPWLRAAYAEALGHPW